MSNEIKQGDKVRVSKDAPKIYAKGWLHDWCNTDSIVKEVDNEDAVIAPITRANDELAIPCKYLVKVGGEYKPKFKKGDKVRFKKVYTVVSVDDGQVFIDSAGNHIDEDCLELYTEPTAPKIKVGDRVRNIESGVIGVVDKIVYGNIAWGNGVDGKRYHWKSDELELIQPTEQTEAKKTDSVVPFSIFRDGGLSNPHIVNLRNGMHYWQCYEADFAREIAVKSMEKSYGCDPERIADYAVSVAKAVVEGLKRK